MADEQVLVDIDGDSTGIDKASERAKRSVHGIGDEAEKTSTKSKSHFALSFGAIAGIASNVFGRVVDSVSNLSGEIIEASDSGQKFAQTMSFAGIGTDAIDKLKASTQDYANRTVYDLNTVRSTTAQLASNGVKGYGELTEAAGNLNAVAGGNADTFKSVAMVLTQTAGEQKLTTENWNQLANAIPGASGKLQEALLKNGAYTGNFRDAMAKGQITADEFNKAITDLGMTQVAKDAATATTTMEGAFGNLQASAVTVGQTVLDGVKPAITGAMSGAADILGTFNDKISSGMSGLGQFFNNASSKIAPVLNLWKQDFADVGNKIMGLVSSFTSFGSSLVNVTSGGDSLTNFMTGLNNVVQPLTTLWGNLASQVSEFINALAKTGGVQSFIGTLGSLWKSGTQVFQALQNIVSGFMSVGNTGGAAASIGTVIGNAFKGAAGIISGVSDVLQGLGGWVMEHADLVRSLLVGIGTAFLVFKVAGIINSAVSAIKAFSLASKLAAVAQQALNLVMSANPIMLVVTAIAAVTAGLVYFFTKTETGRKLWASFMAWFRSAWSSIGTFLTNMWNGISGFFVGIWNGIKSVFSGAVAVINVIIGGIAQFVKNMITGIKVAFAVIATIIVTPFKIAYDLLAPVITGLYNNVIVPVVNAIKNTIQTVWSFISANIITPIRNALTLVGTAFSTLYTNVIQPVWNAISNAFSVAWNFIKSVVLDAWAREINGMKVIFQAVGNVIGTIWNAISNAFSTAWNFIKSVVIAAWTTEINGMKVIFKAVGDVIGTVWNGIRTAFSTAWDWINNTVISPFKKGVSSLGDAMNNMKDMASKAWDSLKEAAAAPVRFVVNTVYTNGIQKVWNGVAGAVGLDKLKLPDAKFATGGVIPGYTPGRDTTIAQVSGGEAIMRPEWTRAVGVNRINAWNALARRGGVGAVSSSLAFADGGVVGTIKSFVGNVVSTVSDIVSNPGEALNKLIVNPIKGLLNGIGGGNWGTVMAQFPIQVATGLVDKVKSSLSAITSSGGGTPGNANFKASAGVSQWTPQVLQALAMLGQPATWLNTVLRRMNQESGGNPNSINNWDSNAKAGIPSQGLMQTIPPTFAAYAGSLAGRGILDPLANIYAGLNYAIHRYGSLSALDRPGGYHLGGRHPEDNELAWFNRDEYTFSSTAARKIGMQNMDYMNRTGEIPSKEGAKIMVNTPTGADPLAVAQQLQHLLDIS